MRSTVHPNWVPKQQRFHFFQAVMRILRRQDVPATEAMTFATKLAQLGRR
jgi:hypothetical protein